MRNSEYRIFLDVQETRSQVQLTARHGDSLRRVRAVLFDHGLPFVQPEGSRAVMIVRLPDGTSVMADCEIYRDGTVVYDFTERVTEQEGLLDCVLEIRSALDEVVAAPVFTILVTESAFDGGAISGREWFENVEEMLAAGLVKGQMVSTRGRWTDNDGGARSYLITDKDGAMLADGVTRNPLALALPNGRLYAVPIITDQVTALDIGLERGRLRAKDLPIGSDGTAYANAHEKDDGGIAATNSAKLQAYLDAIPETGTTGPLYGGAHLNRIFFPAGHWYFRDSVVVRKPVTFIGTRTGTTAREGKRYPTYTSSTLVYLAEEYICVSSSITGSTPKYVGDGCTVIKQPDADKRGDENYDRTVSPAVQESAYIDHALFYAAYDGVNFIGLDFMALAKGASAYVWGHHPNNNDSQEAGPRAFAWKPKGGKPWNPFTARRNYKGVCAVIVRDPKQAGGKIKCKIDAYGSGTVSYEKTKGADVPCYCCVDKCSFYGFSGAAVIAGRLSYLTDSVLFGNYIGYQASQDDFLYNSWIGNGFVGLVTMGYQPLSTSGMYIDMMAGFGVMAYMTHRTFGKRTVKFIKGYDEAQGIYLTGTRGVDDETNVWNNCYFCEHEKPTAGGRFYGHFDIVLDACVMGGYFGYQIDWGAKISGILERCGMLYNCDALIVDKNKFGTQLKYSKAKDFWDKYQTVSPHYGDATTETIRWDETNGKWDTSDSTSLQTIKAYLDADMGWAANVPKAFKYITAIWTASGPDMDAAPPSTYVWDTVSGDWVEPEEENETRQTLSKFLRTVKAYSNVFRYIDWLRAGQDGIQLEASDEKYYGNLTGIEGLDDDTDVIENLIYTYAKNAVTAQAVEDLAAYNAAMGTEYTLEEAVKLEIEYYYDPTNPSAKRVIHTEPTDEDIEHYDEYVHEHWDSIVPADYQGAWKKLIRDDRKSNFYKLVGMSAVSIMLAKSVVFSGQVVACSYKRESRAEVKAADPWYAKENLLTPYGFNVFYAYDAQIHGFSRYPLSRITGENETGMVMTPIIMQCPTGSLLLTAPVHPSENALFYLITNHDDASTANWKYLKISLTHTPEGKVAGFISGHVKLTASSVIQPTGDLESGATAFSSLKLLNYEPYQNHYVGTHVNVLQIPLYAVSAYDAGSVSRGDQVGILVLNFNYPTAYICCYKTYVGEVIPAFL